MNKAELITRVSEISGLTKKDSTSATEAVLTAISVSLAAHNEVKLQGFGNFEIRGRAARKGRNPQSGQEIDIAASNNVGFKPAKSLKDAVN